MTDIRGTWRHYKGHIYEVLGIAKHSETLEELGVAYQRRDTDELTVWVRPEEMFKGRATLEDGSTAVRFERLNSSTSVATAKTLREESEDCAENHYTAEEGRALEARIAELEAQLKQAQEWTDEDKPLPEDGQIDAAHPLQSGEHKLYAEAVRLVGAKRSKYALVDLVHWLLLRIETYERQKRFLKK